MSMKAIASRRVNPELNQFRLLYAVCFSMFLLAAVIQRCLPWTWFGNRDGAMRPSIFTQARNAAGICASYAFMV